MARELRTAGLIWAAEAVGASAATPTTMIDSSQAAGARVTAASIRAPYRNPGQQDPHLRF